MRTLRLHRHLRQGLALALFLLLGLPWLVAAENLPSTEKQKVETLINQVRLLKNASFVRNGWSYNADNAATFLRRKWEANAADVKTAREFVEKIASFSATSGKPYLIRFKDGSEIKSQEFFFAELKKIEPPVP